MSAPPLVAVVFGSDVFFPVAVTSGIGGMICFVSKAVANQQVLLRVAADLVQDLNYADSDRRKLVLLELNPGRRIRPGRNKAWQNLQ